MPGRGRPRLSSDEERKNRIRESNKISFKKYQQTDEYKTYHSLYCKAQYLEKRRNLALEKARDNGIDIHNNFIKSALTIEELNEILKMLNSDINVSKQISFFQ